MANWVRDNLGRSDVRRVSTAQTSENTSGFCQTVMLPSWSLLARLYQWLLASWSGWNPFIWVECEISLCFSFPLCRLLLVVAGWLIAAEKWCSAAECAALCCRRYYDPLHTFLVLNVEGTGGTGKTLPACSVSSIQLGLSHVASVELLSKLTDLRNKVFLLKFYPPWSGWVSIIVWYHGEK